MKKGGKIADKHSANKHETNKGRMLHRLMNQRDFLHGMNRCVHLIQRSSSQQKRTIVHATTFYKRELPSRLVAFSSEAGKKIFRDALKEGHMENFFTLSENLQIQSEPAYCGLGTLTMVLNSLQIDPGRNWKGIWRWFSEDMFDCCTSLATIQKNGITLDQFWCLAKCNGADACLIRTDRSSENEFRRLVRMSTSCNNSNHLFYIVVNFDRKVLEQTGDGHFSVIAGYNEKLDLVLLMETARFKYPSYWVPLSDLWRAMSSLDSTSGKTRGFLTMRSNNDGMSVLYTIFMNHKIPWRQFSLLFTTKIIPDIMSSLSKEDKINTFQEWISLILQRLPQDFINVILDYSRTVILESTSCTDEHRNVVPTLLNDVRNLPLFPLVEYAFQQLSTNRNDQMPFKNDSETCAVQFHSLQHAPRRSEIFVLLLMTCPTDCLYGIVPSEIISIWNNEYRDLNLLTSYISTDLKIELRKMKSLIQTLCSMKQQFAGNTIAMSILSQCSNSRCLKRCLDEQEPLGNDGFILKQDLSKDHQNEITQTPC